MNREKKRLNEQKEQKLPWQKWGCYLSEREWGTVREDYTEYGDAWFCTSHDMAVSKSYRWGEEGIGGICDEQQTLCFSLAFWNKKDPIIKERFFGVSGPEGNHGEDVKEYYYYLDNLPTHSYMKMLYKYPQNEFPYKELLEESKKRTKQQTEFELIDTGIFDNDEYFDIFIEYAKDTPEDILIKISVFNRSINDSEIFVLPHIWFRNTWSWGYDDYKPFLKKGNGNFIEINHKELGEMYLYFSDYTETIFCENETNIKKLYNYSDKSKYHKDGICDYITLNDRSKVNPDKVGTKAAISYHKTIKGTNNLIINLRLSNKKLENPFEGFEDIFLEKIKDADDFYAEIQEKIKNEDEKNIQRQAFAGMLWNKQFYYIDIPQWLNGDPAQPKPPELRKQGRNSDWKHLNNKDIISMPDNWEYPWYASWDLAFHSISFSLIDSEFAKNQLLLLTREWFMHPNGQLPAYEWNFDDTNPPVHAWAAWRVYKIDKKLNNRGDTEFLEKIIHKLIFNFTWWVNKKDKDGRNVFQGGFLGLDNIGLFDRSETFPDGGYIEQTDGTSWMAMFSLNMMRISLELSKEKPIYQDLATKFFEHFLYIAAAMTNIGDDGISLWDEKDEFFYDVLSIPNKNKVPLKIRSIVGLIPLFAVEVIDFDISKESPEFSKRLEWFLNYRPDLADLVSNWDIPGKGSRKLLSLLKGHRMKKLLIRMLDETEFLSDFGIRSLSKSYEKTPYKLIIDETEFHIKYVPGDSDTGLFGGNSNWRGPVWFPINFLIIESLERFHYYYGNDFLIEYPTNSGKTYTLKQISQELTKRLKKIFLKDKNGNRAVYGKNNKFQTDPYFRDYILFYEFFHGETGQGLGASHQTGWTGLIAKLLLPKD